MSANYVEKVIAVAKNEVGYLEKKSNSQLDDKTANSGNGNYTKYNRDMHQLYPSVMDFPAEWCDCFVDWCFMKAYGVQQAKNLIGGNFNDYTPSSANLYKVNDAWFTSPKVGDQIFFKNETRICHTGLVYKVGTKYVYTIEGNVSGAVRMCQYELTDSRIAGYGRPRYDKTPTATPTPSNKVVKIDYATQFDYKLKGSYVTTTGLYLRSGAGKDKSIVAEMKGGDTVNCYGYFTPVNGTKWLLVKYKNLTGFCSSKYLRK